MTALFYAGDDGRKGSYVLRMILKHRLEMSFGQFKGGKRVVLHPGEYLYIGSAMSEKGATCLAKRVVRHATRTEGKEPHAIRTQMLTEFPEVGLADGDLNPPTGKTLRWNIDHLLDAHEVDLGSAFLVRSPRKLEPEIGDLLEADPYTFVFEKGLGANDRLVRLICLVWTLTKTGGTNLLPASIRSASLWRA